MGSSFLNTLFTKLLRQEKPEGGKRNVRKRHHSLHIHEWRDPTDEIMNRSQQEQQQQQTSRNPEVKRRRKQNTSSAPKPQKRKRNSSLFSSLLCISANPEPPDPQSQPGVNPKQKRHHAKSRQQQEQEDRIVMSKAKDDIKLRNSSHGGDENVKEINKKKRHSAPVPHWYSVTAQDDCFFHNEHHDEIPRPHSSASRVETPIKYRTDGTLERPYVFPSQMTFTAGKRVDNFHKSVPPSGRLRSGSWSDVQTTVDVHNGHQLQTHNSHYQEHSTDQDSPGSSVAANDRRKSSGGQARPTSEYYSYDRHAENTHRRRNSKQGDGRVRREISIYEADIRQQFYLKFDRVERESSRRKKKNRYSMPPEADRQSMPHEEGASGRDYQNRSLDEDRMTRHRNIQTSEDIQEHVGQDMEVDGVDSRNTRISEYDTDVTNNNRSVIDRNQYIITSGNNPSNLEQNNKNTQVENQFVQDSEFNMTDLDVFPILRPKDLNLNNNPDYRYSLPPSFSHDIRFDNIKSASAINNDQRKAYFVHSDEEDECDSNGNNTQSLTRPPAFSRGLGRKSCMPGNKRFSAPPPVCMLENREFTIPPPPLDTPPEEDSDEEVEVENRFERSRHKGSQTDLTEDVVDSPDMVEMETSLEKCHIFMTPSNRHSTGFDVATINNEHGDVLVDTGCDPIADGSDEHFERDSKPDNNKMISKASDNFLEQRTERHASGVQHVPRESHIVKASGTQVSPDSSPTNHSARLQRRSCSHDPTVPNSEELISNEAKLRNVLTPPATPLTPTPAPLAKWEGSFDLLDENTDKTTSDLALLPSSPAHVHTERDRQTNDDNERQALPTNCNGDQSQTMSQMHQILNASDGLVPGSVNVVSSTPKSSRKSSSLEENDVQQARPKPTPPPRKRLNTKTSSTSSDRSYDENVFSSLPSKPKPTNLNNSYGEQYSTRTVPVPKKRMSLNLESLTTSDSGDGLTPSNEMNPRQSVAAPISEDVFEQHLEHSSHEDYPKTSTMKDASPSEGDLNNSQTEHHNIISNHSLNAEDSLSNTQSSSSENGSNPKPEGSLNIRNSKESAEASPTMDRNRQQQVVRFTDGSTSESSDSSPRWSPTPNCVHEPDDMPDDDDVHFPPVEEVQLVTSPTAARRRLGALPKSASVDCLDVSRRFYYSGLSSSMGNILDALTDVDNDNSEADDEMSVHNDDDNAKIEGLLRAGSIRDGYSD